MSAHRFFRKVALTVSVFVVLALLTGARYRVREGETFGSVAEAFGVPEDALRKHNPTIIELSAGQIIVVPEIKPEQRWSPSKPYAPPVPTVRQLQEDLIAKRVTIAAHGDKPDIYILRAGPNLDIDIGELRVQTSGDKRLFNIYLRGAVGHANPENSDELKSIGHLKPDRTTAKPESKKRKPRVSLPDPGCGLR